MKKILFSFMLLAITLFCVGFVNAEEEQEWVDYNFTVETIPGGTFATDNFITQFYYADWENVDLETLDIYIDDVLVVDDGVSLKPYPATMGIPSESSNMLFSYGDRTENYDLAIAVKKTGESFAYALDINDDEVDFIN